MFSLITFKANGERTENVAERPAFYALTYRGVVVDYFASLQALKLAHVACLSCIAELNQENETCELELAA